MKFWIILECVEALVLSQKHSFELSYKCCVKRTIHFNVGSWINLREGNCTLKFYCFKTQYFWCSVITWCFYSVIEALNLELGGDNSCVKPFAIQFHCWISGGTEALWVFSFFFFLNFLKRWLNRIKENLTHYWIFWHIARSPSSRHFDYFL